MEPETRGGAEIWPRFPINMQPVAHDTHITHAESLAVRSPSACCPRACVLRVNTAEAFSLKELTSSTTNEKLLPSAASLGGRADKG